MPLANSVPMRRLIAFIIALACCALPASARSPVRIGTFPPGAADGITDVAGVRVAHVTKIEGTNVRTGATAIIANDDTWNERVAAATYRSQRQRRDDRRALGRPVRASWKCRSC